MSWAHFMKDNALTQNQAEKALKNAGLSTEPCDWSSDDVINAAAVLDAAFKAKLKAVRA